MSSTNVAIVTGAGGLVAVPVAAEVVGDDAEVAREDRDVPAPARDVAAHALEQDQRWGELLGSVDLVRTGGRRPGGSGPASAGDGYAVAACVASRSRPAIDSRVFTAIDGCSLEEPSEDPLGQAEQPEVRPSGHRGGQEGMPSSNAISPKKSPRRRIAIRLPPIVTSASPSTITNRPTPGSPSVAITVPRG